MIIKTSKRMDPALRTRILGLKAVLPAEEARSYLDHGERQESRDAAHRKTEVRWILREQYPDIHQELLKTVAQHQRQLGVMSGVTIERGVQLSTYYVGDHFDWHFDGLVSDATRRILSMSVLLTDDFEGGRLEFRTPGAPRLKKAGDIIVFNSGEYHRVNKVTKGVRDSLVVWFKAG